MPEIIDPVFAKTSPNPSFSMTEYERFGLVFTKTRVYKFGHQSLRLFFTILYKALKYCAGLLKQYMGAKKRVGIGLLYRIFKCFWGPGIDSEE
jgi:hypothetical protein